MSYTMDWNDLSGTILMLSTKESRARSEASFSSVSSLSLLHVSRSSPSAGSSGPQVSGDLPGEYRSVLEQLKDSVDPDLNTPGDYLDTSGTSKNQWKSGVLQIAPLPKNLNSVSEKQRQECTDSLLESEQSLGKTIQQLSLKDALQTDWNNFTSAVLLDLSAVSSGGFSDMLRTQHNRVKELKAAEKANPGTRSRNRSMTSEEVLCARTLRQCNEDIICQRRLNMAEKFVAVVEESGNNQAQQFWQAFHAVFTNRNPKPSQEGVLEYRQSPSFQQDVIRRARLYLENATYENLLGRPRTKPSTSNAHSVEELHIVMSYARSHLAKHKSTIPSTTVSAKIHGLPIWAVIYYSLRLGCVGIAIEICREGSGAGTQELEPYLVEYKKTEGRISSSSEAKLQSIYRSQAAVDNMFQKAVLAVLTGSDGTESTAFTVSDWLWLKLVQTNATGKGFTFAKLQEQTLTRFGGDAVDNAESFLAFVLTGQLELALERLYRAVSYRIHSVHMALSAKYAGILLVSSDVGCLELIRPPMNMENVTYYLDFVPMLKIYVRDFRQQNAEVVMEYYFHFADIPVAKNSSSDYRLKNLFEYCIFVLAKECDNVASLFGQVEGDGERMVQVKHGVVHKFVSHPEALMDAIAKDYEKNERLGDAVKLYEISGEITLMLRALLQWLCTNLLLSVDDPKRTVAKALGRRCMDRYKDNNLSDALLARNVFLMLDLMTFFDEFDKKHYRQALLVMKNLYMVPLDHSNLPDAINLYSNGLLTEVRRCVPETVLYTMRALVNLYLLEKEHAVGTRLLTGNSWERLPGSSPTAGVKLNEEIIRMQTLYRQQCRPLLEYAQIIPAPLFPDLVECLLKLEAAIN